MDKKNKEYNVDNMPLNYIESGAKRYFNAQLVRLKDTEIGDIIYENYDGVNMDLNSKQGGYVLRIRKLQKMGKIIVREEDIETVKGERYLYNGYIYNTFRENDREIEDLDKEAYPVCFETSMRLEDIAQSDIKEIRSGFLKFLSDKDSFERKQTVKYIGFYYIKYKKDIEGITGECCFEKGKISSSPTIQRQIEKIQNEYLERKNNPNNSDNTGSISNIGNTANLPKYDDAR